MTPSERVAFRQLQLERCARGEITKQEMDESLFNKEREDDYDNLVTLRLQADDIFTDGSLSKFKVDRELAEAAYRAAFHAYVDKYINKRGT